MTKDELKRALCAEAGGDLNRCKACQHKCLIGKRLINWTPAKRYTTVGVPGYISVDTLSSGKDSGSKLRTSERTRDAYNAQRAQEAQDKISRGLAVLKAGGTREEAVKASGYGGWKAFYDAVIFRGRRNEILDDQSNAAKSANASIRYKECFEQMLAGKPMEQIAADHGYKSVDSLVHALRVNRDNCLHSEFDDYAITTHGLVKGKRRCTRSTKSPQKTSSS